MHDARCGRTQDAHRPAQPGIDFRRLDRVVERRLGLVIRTIVALVCDDQADIRQWTEERAARPDDDFQQAESRPPPGIVALALGEFRVHQANLPREARQEAAHGLWGERDFRDEDDGLFAAPDGFGCGAQVDLGLARAGDSMKEEG